MRGVAGWGVMEDDWTSGKAACASKALARSRVATSKHEVSDAHAVACEGIWHLLA